MRRLVVAALSLGACASAEAGASAYFLGTAVYATEEGCVKLKALAAGGPKNVGTVPETLTSGGFKSWEGGCAFGSIQERRRHKLYVSRMTCFEGPERWLEKNSFELDLKARTVTVTVAEGRTKKTTVFKKCDAGKGK